MSSSYINNTSSSGLSTPKIRLNHNSNGVSQFKTIEWYNYNTNTVGGVFNLYNFPEIVAVDLTDEQIEKGVYIEMIEYKKGHNNNSYINSQTDSAYKVSPSWISGVNLFDNMWTRGGKQTISNGSLLAVDRPNHYKVTSHNQVINVWEYLKNRHSKIDVLYRDVLGNQQQLTCLCPSSRLRGYSKYPSSRFAYSGMYRPFYFAFRYLMYDDVTKKFQTGGITRVIKMTHKAMPFEYNQVASGINNVPCCDISADFNVDEMKCFFETKLP